MKAFLAIVRWEPDNRGVKYIDFDTQAEADAHIAAVASRFPLGFVAPYPGGVSEDWLVDPATNTVSMTPLPAPPPEFLITYTEFQDRFTAAEFDDATEFVYETNTTTTNSVGKPKRKALIQGLSRTIARNSVDLLHAKTAGFMATLVAGGVVTQARADTILDPTV